MELIINILALIGAMAVVGFFGVVIMMYKISKEVSTEYPGECPQCGAIKGDVKSYCIQCAEEEPRLRTWQEDH